MFVVSNLVLQWVPGSGKVVRGDTKMSLGRVSPGVSQRGVVSDDSYLIVLIVCVLPFATSFRLSNCSITYLFSRFNPSFCQTFFQVVCQTSSRNVKISFLQSLKTLSALVIFRNLSEPFLWLKFGMISLLLLDYD